jgi:hypothetical protein
MSHYSAVSTVQAAVSLALDELRIVLTFVRDSAALVGDLLSAIIQRMKHGALVLLLRLSTLMNSPSSVKKAVVPHATKQRRVITRQVIPIPSQSVLTFWG